MTLTNTSNTAAQKIDVLSSSQNTHGLCKLEYCSRFLIMGKTQ